MRLGRGREHFEFRDNFVRRSAGLAGPQNVLYGTAVGIFPFLHEEAHTHDARSAQRRWNVLSVPKPLILFLFRVRVVVRLTLRCAEAPP